MTCHHKNIAEEGLQYYENGQLYFCKKCKKPLYKASTLNKKEILILIFFLIHIIALIAIYFRIPVAQGFSNEERIYLDRILPVSRSYIEQYGPQLPNNLEILDGVPDSKTAIGEQKNGKIYLNSKKFFDLPEGDRRGVLIHEMLHTIDPRPYNRDWTERFTQYATQRIMHEWNLTKHPYSTFYLEMVLDYIDTGTLVNWYATQHDYSFIPQ